MFEGRSHEAVLTGLYRSSAVEVRTRYENTLRTLDAAFNADESLCLFFEELFREDTLARLCRHLGIDYEPALFDAKVNESQGPAPDIDIELQRKIARHYSGTYAFVAERFGEASMKRLWGGYALLA
jgi:acyl-homoserine lactone acylase PvdQ